MQPLKIVHGNFQSPLRIHSKWPSQKRLPEGFSGIGIITLNKTKEKQHIISLDCHPASVCIAVKSIQVVIEQSAPTQLNLSYVVYGDMSGVRVPELATGARQDELWRHTCAELFVCASDNDDYLEFNFSPSTRWAAYGFTRYRQGMHPIECAQPIIAVERSAGHLKMDVKLELPLGLTADPQLRIGLSMVIEENAGQCSYWAIKHVGQAPDFHHPESFVVNL